MKRVLRMRERAFLGKSFLVLGMLSFLLGASSSITGNFVGASSFFDGTASFMVLGLCFLFASFLFLSSQQRALEAIIVPTGESGKIDRQRAQAGAKLYKTHPHSKVIISGVLNNGKFFGSQSSAIYRTLRKEGVSRGDIEIEGKSHNTLENVRYVSKLLEDEDIHHITLVTDRDHARRMSMLFQKAKEEGLAPKDLDIDTYTKGIDKAYDSVRAELAYVKDSVRRVKDGSLNALPGADYSSLPFVRGLKKFFQSRGKKDT